MAKLERLDDFAVAGSSAAKVEILTHLDGDLVSRGPRSAAAQKATAS
jgi:hypothetical protein